MNAELLNGLKLQETDIDGALYRFSGDEDFYVSLFPCFIEDETIEQLDQALHAEAWDEAFTAAHALKGLAGNMGFVPLFQATGELVLLIRKGKIGEVEKAMKKVRQCYNDIILVIK